MHIALVILVFHCTPSLTIKVPVTWDNDSEVKPVNQDKNNDYFHYAANKPQFAVEVAQFHNVKSPEKHYESYSINPHTGLKKPTFGKHQMLNSGNKNYKPYQEYIKQDYGQVKPIINHYEVYHPYQAEVPALQTIYNDPILHKIRNDVYDSNKKLQKYEHDAGELDVHKDEYLERPDSIDKKKIPQRNMTAQYEIHRPLRRPLYYQRVPSNNNRDHFLNQKLRHPWSQHSVKVSPMHYHPIKHHLHQLRQQHSLTYDDANNEYPQIIPPEQYAERPEGYDIFERGKENYKNIRNGFEESIDKAVLKNTPALMDNLELQKDEQTSNYENNEDEDFIPVKNYAQVRKTATYKHVPKSDAYKDAENYEEIQNAPRLREAVKSSKNQVVYSEEGYEDSAYDHAGEKKHASDHEGHGGFLTEHEASKGKYKTPSIDTSFTDEGKTSSRNQELHGEKFNDEHAENLEEYDSEDSSESENDYYENADTEIPDNDDISERNKRDSNSTISLSENLHDHDLSKREVNSNNTTLKDKEELKNRSLAREKLKNAMNKYPYYFNSSKALDKNSPLRYSENFNLIPDKIKDNSAFYNSRISLLCPEVETEVNPVPDKFNNGEVSQDTEDEDYNNDEKGEEEFKSFKNKQRLRKLGDKIDCLKMKYFGEEPFDSPFFKEELISNPQPLAQIHKGFSPVGKQDKLSIKQPKFPEASNYLEHQNEGKYLNENNTFLFLPLATTTLNNTLKSDNYINNLTHIMNPSNYSNEKDVGRLTTRRRRAVTFMYEPYKIIKESQAIDSKKVSTLSNISPLLRKLHTRQTVDYNGSNIQKHYRDISKNDRPLNEQDIIDVTKDPRRGEPRYEIDLKNHRPHYNPVENKTSMSVEDYRARTDNENDKSQNNKQQISNKTQSISFKYIPRTVTTQSIAASNIISKMIRSTTIKPQNLKEDLYDDYEEYDDDSGEKTDEIEFHTTSTTTSTTSKPKIRKRIRLAPTAKSNEEKTSKSMNLQLTTRFHTTTTDASPINIDPPEHIEEHIKTPNYREKKKKTTKSTLVTDTESYGDDIDDMRKFEIDAMIGVKQNMDEYTPSYEKENKQSDETLKNSYEREIDDQIREGDESEEEDDDEDDSSSEEDEYADDVEEELDEMPKIQESNDKNNKDTLPHSRNKVEVTTSEPTKRTLIKTTEPTTATEVLYSEQQPKVYRKKIEIHKELPVNKTSPHVTHYKQDIKQVEIIKELDSSHPKKKGHPGSLNLYKDENLAREINNLGDVDIFNDNLDLASSPQHGGNYRNIEHIEKPETDVETSQTEAKRTIKHKTSTIRPRNQNYRNVESNTDKGDKPNATSRTRNINRRRKVNRPEEKSAKLIELQDYDNNDEDIRNSNVYSGNSKSYITRNNDKPMHGGNYRSAKLLDKNSQEVSTSRNRKSEAEVLNAYAKAVTELTTTPAFILDPSKRMYYYLED